MNDSHNPFHHRARKRFGQNFLVDENVIQHIVAELAPQRNEHLIEIGPGKGVITGLVLPHCDHLSVIELDRDLVGYLQDRYGNDPHFSIYNHDILKFDLATITDQKVRVFGNLPYNISSPIIFHLIEQRHLISEMLFMFQREVVQRLAAKPHSKEYGRLTVMAGYWLEVEPLWEIQPNAFNPQPKVVSQIVRLKPKTAPTVIVNNEELFSKVVMMAFNMRRKTIGNSLKALMTAEKIHTAGLNPAMRAEELTIDDFVRLSNLI